MVRITQTIRAILAAKATVTLFLRILLSSPSSHGSNRSLLLSRCVTQDRAPWAIILRRYLLPRLLIPSSLVFPPVEYSRGTRPSQAARSRASRNRRPGTPRCQQSVRCQLTDARRGHQGPCGVATRCDRIDLLVHGCNTLCDLHHLPVNLRQDAAH